MMTLDEAIQHAREIAEKNRNSYKNCPRHREDIEHQTCQECAEEHEQLANWLEELKKHRESSQKIRNEAIDDFIAKCKSNPKYGLITNWDKPYGITFERMKDIASELKD